MNWHDLIALKAFEYSFKLNNEIDNTAKQFIVERAYKKISDMAKPRIGFLESDPHFHAEALERMIKYEVDNLLLDESVIGFAVATSAVKYKNLLDMVNE